MDKFDKQRGGNRYNNNYDDPHNYNDSIRRGGGDVPGYTNRHENYRISGGGRGSSAYRSGFPSSGGGDAGEDNRSFDSPPGHPLPMTGGDGGRGGGLRPVGDGVGDFPPMVAGGRSGGGFRQMGSGGTGFRPIGGGVGEFGAIGGAIGGATDGARFGPVVGGGGERFGPVGGGRGETFTPMGVAGGERFRPMGGGNGERFHPMSGGVHGERFGSTGGGGKNGERFGSMGSVGVDGERFQRMGGAGDDGERFREMAETENFGPMGGVSGSDAEMFGSVEREDVGFGSDSGPPPSLAGQKRGYSFYGRERSPDRSDGGSFVKLFVGSVPRTATEVDVRPLFDKHGRVLEVALIKDKRTGQQQGCCFIKYASSEEADRAIRALHNQYTLPGGLGPIQVRYADGERERLGATEFKLFVGSLNKNATEKEVEEVFLPYGRVEDVYLMRDEMKQSRGCGFVKYSQREMALAAINALNGTYTMRGCEQPLNVRFADPKRPKPGESRGGPNFGGSGFGPRFPAPGIRSAPDFVEPPLHGHMPPTSWPPTTSIGPPHAVGVHGFAKQLPTRSGDMAGHSTPGVIGGRPGNSDGSLPGPVVSAPVAQLSMSQNITSVNTQSSQGSQMHLAPVQMPHPAIETPASQDPSSRQLPGFNGHLHYSQIQGQHYASLTPGRAPGSANQQLPVQQPQPVSQSPSHLAQMLSQQKQTLQATFKSSQQAFNQLQQQVQQLQPPIQNVTVHQDQPAIRQQSPWAGIASLPISSIPSVQQSGDAAPTTSASFSALSADPAMATVNCSWTEHTSPDGYKYYYNSLTGESKWEKPEELMRYEQSRQHNKSYSQHSQMQSHPQGPSSQQFAQRQVEVQGQHQAQIQNQIQPLQQSSRSSSHQASGVSAKQNSKELGYAPIPLGTGPGIESTRYQQVSQEWMWKNKPSGT